MEFTSSDYSKLIQEWSSHVKPLAPIPSCEFDLVIHGNNKMNGANLRMHALAVPAVGLGFDTGSEYFGHSVPMINYAAGSIQFYIADFGKESLLSVHNPLWGMYRSQFNKNGTLKYPGKCHLYRDCKADIMIGGAVYAQLSKLRLGTPKPTNLSFSDVGNPVIMSVELYFNNIDYK